jgi:hypothetical protein
MKIEARTRQICSANNAQETFGLMFLMRQLMLDAINEFMITKTILTSFWIAGFTAGLRTLRYVRGQLLPTSSIFQVVALGIAYRCAVASLNPFK